MKKRSTIIFLIFCIIIIFVGCSGRASMGTVTNSNAAVSASAQTTQAVPTA